MTPANGLSVSPILTAQALCSGTTRAASLSGSSQKQANKAPVKQPMAGTARMAGVVGVSRPSQSERQGLSCHPFEEALTAMKDGKVVRRSGWNDESHIRWTSRGFSCHRGVGWLPTTDDLIAVDWQILNAG